MEKNLSNQDDSVASLWNQLLSADVVRAAHKPREAFAMFQDALQSKTFECLSPARQRWARAHAGTAATEIFEPYHEETMVFLDQGENLLWQALELNHKTLVEHKAFPELKLKALPELKLEAPRPRQDDKTGPAYDSAWTWAKLGENYRLRGNLPTMHVIAGNDGRPEVVSRDSKAVYCLGIRCFKNALELRKDYGWAKAHLGALIVNARRYQPEPIELGLTYLLEADASQAYANPWTQAYVGCANFALGLEKIRNPQPQDPSNAFPSELLLCIAHILLGWHRAPHLLDHAVQPGAVNLDRPFAMLYDLIEILPHVKLKDQTAKQIVEYAKTLAWSDAVNPEGGVDRDWASAVRLEHFRLFIEYLAQKHKPREQSDPLGKEASALLDNAFRFCRQIERQGPLNTTRDRGILNNVLSVELTLLKVAAMFNKPDTPERKAILDRTVEYLLLLNGIVGIVKGEEASEEKQLERAYKAIAAQAQGDSTILSPVSTLRYDYTHNWKLRGTLNPDLAQYVTFGRTA